MVNAYLIWGCENEKLLVNPFITLNTTKGHIYSIPWRSGVSVWSCVCGACIVYATMLISLNVLVIFILRHSRKLVKVRRPLSFRMEKSQIDVDVVFVRLFFFFFSNSLYFLFVGTSAKVICRIIHFGRVKVSDFPDPIKTVSTVSPDTFALLTLFFAG